MDENKVRERQKVFARAIRRALSDDLRRPRYQGHPNPVAGHCYVASEALYHLMGGRRSGMKPMFIQHEGEPHWFLWDARQNRPVDLTEKQFETPVPHRQGRGTGFLTRRPSRRARMLIGRVKKALSQNKNERTKR